MMLPWQRKTIPSTNIKNALQFYSRIILVTGYRGNEPHERHVNQDNITTTRNPDYTQGLLTSVKAAVPTVQTEHCFLTHGGMPAPTIDIFRKIWSLRSDDVMLPLRNGVPGYPILVSKPCLTQAIQRLNVTSVCRALLMGEHYPIEIENAGVISGTDTPDNLITAEKRCTEIQKAQSDDCAQISSPSNTFYRNDKGSLILRKEKIQ